MPKLLVFTPTYGDGLLDSTLDAVAALAFDGTLTPVISRHNPYPGKDMRNVTAQYQRGRQMVLDGDYDGLLCVEHDMIPPPHAAQTLWDDGAPVVYGVYRLRHDTHVLNAWTRNGKRLGKPMSFYPGLIAQARRDGRIECAGLGFGCTLMRREVLQRITFRDESGNAPDTPFAKDCLRKGIQQIARFDVACQHVEDGVALEAFTDGGTASRVYALQDAMLEMDSRPYVVERHRYYTVPPSVAAVWAKAGHVRITSGQYAP